MMLIAPTGPLTRRHGLGAATAQTVNALAAALYAVATKATKRP